MGNCSCVNNSAENKTQFTILDEKTEKINEDELLDNIKSKSEGSFTLIKAITQDEFEQKLYSFPNIKEIFNEYNSKISDLSQNQMQEISSTDSDSRGKELIELPNPIELFEDEQNCDFFKGFVNKDYNLTGKGCYIKNDFIYYGYFINNQFNGKGVLIDKEGSSLFGDWVNGVCTGKGHLKRNDNYEYEGDYVENKKQGQGKEKNPDGSIYEGQFQNDKKNGKGKYVMSQGEIYEGDFKDDIIDGYGTYKWPLDSREYTGQFKNGNIDGKGINKFKDGSIYEGYYKNGLKNGQGKYTWPDGKVFTGNWINDILHGNGCYEIDNEKYIIIFRYGKIISERICLDPNTKKTFKDGNIIYKENLEDVNKYICSLCNTLIIIPQKCCKCSNNYCITCIRDENENKPCPNCGGKEYEQNSDLLNELKSKIKVNCNICQKDLDYKAYLAHYHS